MTTSWIISCLICIWMGYTHGRVFVDYQRRLSSGGWESSRWSSACHSMVFISMIIYLLAAIFSFTYAAVAIIGPLLYPHIYNLSAHS